MTDKTKISDLNKSKNIPMKYNKWLGWVINKEEINYETR